MTSFLLGFIAAFAAWFAYGVFKKRSYYSEVEAVMRSKGCMPASLILLMGVREYGDALEECRRRGFSSYEAADSLIRYFDEQSG